MIHRAANSSSLDFLHAELETAQKRVNRLKAAIQHCVDCLEDEALRSSLHAAETQQELLRGLRTVQERDRHVSLESVLVGQMNRSDMEASRLARTWRRGRATPDGYWQAELTREFLGELLRRFHTWDAAHLGTPYGAPDALFSGDDDYSMRPAYPWFITSAPVEGGRHPATLTTVEIEALQEILRHEVEDEIDPAHVEIVVEPDGQVIVTGYVHSNEQREVVLEAILDTDGVREVVSDLRVVTPDDCPICWNQRAAAWPGEPTTPAPASDPPARS